MVTRDQRKLAEKPISATFAIDFERLAAALALIARAVPDRVTIRQTLGLALVAYADSMGRSITLKDLQELGGYTDDGRRVIGQSIERTMDTFREPNDRNPDALGWVRVEEDPNDRRKKYLRLTPLGIQALTRVRNALAHGLE